MMDGIGPGTVATAIFVVLGVGGIIFSLGQWKGKVDEAHSTFKRTLDAFMVEIRADIKRIFERLPSETVSGANPLRLTAKCQRRSESAREWPE